MSDDGVAGDDTRRASMRPTDDAPPEGDELDVLVAVILHDLRVMAHRQLAGERNHVTLQTTELVHEAYLRLAGDRRVADRGKPYVYAAAARAMRQVLVDASRRRNAGKRGDGVVALSLDDASGLIDAFSHDLLDLDDALSILERESPRAARVVELRFFANMTVEETAQALSISARTVKADWAFARERLYVALRDDAQVPGASDSAAADERPATLDLVLAASLLGHDNEVTLDGMSDRYVVRGELGRGATSVVFLARDVTQDRDVAVKVLVRWLCADPNTSRRFLNEVRAIRQLTHRCISPVYDAGTTVDGLLYIVMAYHEGPTLRARLAAGPLSLNDALGIAIDVADGLSAVHEHAIVHRDIKPENILLTAEGARIVDFGIARLDGESHTRPGTVLGTAAYMSPEQSRGDVVDVRTDVWALGVVLHEMLSGVRPSHGTPPPHDVPPRVQRVLQHCLANDRAARYPSAAVLRDALTICRARRAIPD